jgi:hypothetical protein
VIGVQDTNNAAVLKIQNWHYNQRVEHSRTNSGTGFNNLNLHFQGADRENF